ncbi:glycosyltransferase family 4 protein [Aequorivita nionensis]|jgi:glycosyltransferase involved in cell wall biosynthesis|uniref:glycosyltransferase family 4 protein n=1 Tax=Aequorivita nionensis TaxID=1287690 RepID=UPI0039659982
MNNKKLAIFGPYPPPLGGMSVHIQRMEPFLIATGIQYTIFNHGYFQKENVIATNKSPFFYLKILFNRKFDYIHFHQIFPFEFLFYFLFSRINKTPLLITIHAETLFKFSKRKLNLILFFIKQTKRMDIISVSENLNDLLVKNEINSIFLPAYVPPSNVNFVPLEGDGRIDFLFSMWKFNEHNANGTYNTPLIFEFLSKNKHTYRMLFLIGDELESDRSYLNKLLEEYDIVDSVIVLYGKNLVDYVQNCRFLLRTNRIDGYGVSLQEAMDLGVPALATSVCTRPKGTVLFKNDDLEDMKQKINYVISQKPKDLLRHKEELTDHLKLLKIYKNNL